MAGRTPWSTQSPVCHWARTQRHGAECAFGKALRLQTQGVVITSAIILPRDCGRQFNHLPVIELLLQLIEKRVWNVDRGARHLDRVPDHELLEITEIGRRLVI